MVGKLLRQSDDPQVQEARNMAHDYNDCAKNLDKVFDTCMSKYTKTNGAFTGDGTEAHFAFEKKYPEYKKASDQYRKAMKDLIKITKALAKKPEFKYSSAFDKCRDYWEKISPSDGKAWYKTANTTAFVLAQIMATEGTKRSTVDIFPRQFMEAYDDTWKKIQDYDY